MEDTPQQPAAALPPYAWLWSRRWLLALGLAVVTFVAYEPVWHAGFIWDDDGHVTRNVNLRTWHGLYRIWCEPLADQQYYPLQLTSYWIEYHLWGLRPFGYHAVNVLLHALNALLLWMVLQQLEIPGAWLAAAVFAVHPVEVESVAWVSELKNLLSATFYLGTLLAYFRFRPLRGRARAGSPPWRYYWLAMGLFVCALLSKTVACTLPVVLILLIWWKRGRVEKREMRLLSPMFVLGISLGLMTAWLEKHHVGASGPEWSLSILQRCLLAGRALWFYAGKLLWPYPLVFIYPHWEIDPGTWWSYVFPVAAMVVVITLWSLRTRMGRGPLVAVLCFAGTLAPALGFFDVFPFRYSYVADHFQYLASIGLITLAASTGTLVCQRAGPRGGDWGRLVAVTVLLVLGVLTWRQARIYQDAETLWRDTIGKNSRCWLAHNNLGDVFLQEGKVGDAIGQYEEVLRIKPDYAEAHYNLGIALTQTGQIEEAIAHYEEAVRINPDYAEAHSNLGTALIREGKVSEAIAQYEQALRIAPDFANVHNNLGIVLAQTGQVEEAIAHYGQALRINPDYAEAHYNLGNALAQIGQVPEAIAQYERALQIKPDFTQAQNALARLQPRQ